MIRLFKFNGDISWTKRKDLVYRAEIYTKDTIYKIWSEDIGWRIEYWYRDGYTASYVRTLMWRNIKELLPLEIYNSNWTIFGWLPI